MKHFLSAMILMLSSTHAPHLLGMSDAYTTLVRAGVGTGIVAGLYKIHQKIRTPGQFQPTVENINLVLMSPCHKAKDAILPVSYLIANLTKGILAQQVIIRVKKQNNPEPWSVSRSLSNQENTLFMYSRGNSDHVAPGIDTLICATGTMRIGGGILESYRYVRENIINGPCITFDYFDSFGTLSFGQDTEKNTLKIAYQETVSKNPQAQIVYMGLCRGARLGLDLAADNSKNLAALILESPLVSFREATYHIGQKFLPGLPGNRSIMFNFFRYWFPSYDPAKDDIMHKIKQIPSTIPILIGHLKGDIVISDDILYQVLRELQGRDNIYLFVLQDRTGRLFHGKLSITRQYQQVCNAFLAAYNKPHNTLLAQEGKQLLQTARANACSSPHEWSAAVHE